MIPSVRPPIVLKRDVETNYAAVVLAVNLQVRYQALQMANQCPARGALEFHLG